MRLDHSRHLWQLEKLCGATKYLSSRAHAGCYYRSLVNQVIEEKMTVLFVVFIIYFQGAFRLKCRKHMTKAAYQMKANSQIMRLFHHRRQRKRKSKAKAREVGTMYFITSETNNDVVISRGNQQWRHEMSQVLYSPQPKIPYKMAACQNSRGHAGKIWLRSIKKIGETKNIANLMALPLELARKSTFPIIKIDRVKF